MNKQRFFIGSRGGRHGDSTPQRDARGSSQAKKNQIEARIQHTDGLPVALNVVGSEVSARDVCRIPPIL